MSYDGWGCTACGTWNKTSAMSCRLCGRPDSPDTWTLPAREDWTCRKCEAFNSNGENNCHECGAEYPVDILPLQEALDAANAEITRQKYVIRRLVNALRQCIRLRPERSMVMEGRVLAELGLTWADGEREAQ